MFLYSEDQALDLSLVAVSALPRKEVFLDTQVLVAVEEPITDLLAKF